MIPEIAMGDFNGIGTPRSYHRGARDQQKNPSTRIFNFESAKSQFNLKCLELKFRLAFVLQNCFALVFKEMDHCCVVCCITVQI
jgi:hypothetical protein